MKIACGLMLFFAFASINKSSGQHDRLFIYGRVVTIDDETYTGALRWGKEEIFWTDHFNASKTKNDYLNYLPEKEQFQVSNSDSWTIKLMKWGKHDYEHIHQWICQFGDLRSIETTSRGNVRITLKDGTVLNLDDGSNDIGTTIRISDSDIGIVELDWCQIKQIEFLPTPAFLENKFGKPLYGTVITDMDTFSGLIQWDHDERISTDELDGENEDGNFSIKFEKIRSISNRDNKSLVQLVSGRELILEGSNDVNDENRGIIVSMTDVGLVDIPWEAFQRVEFDHSKKYIGPGYTDFKPPRKLNGQVSTKDGQIVSGRIAYDLDETMDIEIIQGIEDQIEYLIPLRNIKQIVPKSHDYATVTLNTGKKVMIGEGQDVSDKNDGVLVFTDHSNPHYFKWDNIKEIEFK